MGAPWSGVPIFRGKEHMDIEYLNGTRKITVSGIVMAIYIVLMVLTQSFSFGQYQIRIATAIYGTAYVFPFLVIPLALSNLLSNLLMGGLGLLDIVGGGLVGAATAGVCALLGKKKLSPWLTLLPVALIPALGVSLWLSVLLDVPYPVMAGSLLVGQTICGIISAVLVKSLLRIRKEK